MSIINQLVETKESIKRSNSHQFDKEFTLRLLEGIQINDSLLMSIQASYAHYCTPKETLKDLNEYSTLEFALIDKAGNFLTLTEVLPDFDKSEEVESCYNSVVYGYVPVNLINEVYMGLKLKMKLGDDQH